MTSILIIGDIVRTETGHDMIIGFTNHNGMFGTDKVILESGGISDEERFDVIGNYDSTEHTLTLYNEQGAITCNTGS